MMSEQTREVLVDRVRSLRAEGKSRAEMGKTLNSEGLKTPAGKDWTDVLIGAFMNRHNITTSNPVKTEAKEIKPSGKEINKVMATAAKKGGARKAPAKVFKRTEVRAEFGQGKTTFTAPGFDQDLIAIVTSVISGPLTREQKVRAFSALI